MRGMGADGRQHQGFETGFQDRAAGGHGVGRGSGWRGNNQTVAPERRHELFVDLNARGNHASRSPFADDRVVECRLFLPFSGFVTDMGFEAQAVIHVEFLRKDSFQGVVYRFYRAFRQKPQASQIDAQDRDGSFFDEPGCPQHRAVSAEHEYEVGLGGDLLIDLLWAFVKMVPGRGADQDGLLFTSEPVEQLLKEGANVGKLRLGQDADDCHERLMR